MLALSRATAVLTVLLAAATCASCTSSFPATVAVDAFGSIDGPFSAFAGIRGKSPDLRGGVQPSREDTQADGARLRAGAHESQRLQHWRALAFAHPAPNADVARPASTPAESSPASIAFVAQRVYDSLAVASGVVVMGMSILLP